MNSMLSTDEESFVARTVAPEDLRRGDFIAVLDVIYELPSFLWCFEPHLLPPQEVVRVQFRSGDAGRPLKIKSICLPYVLVTTPDQLQETLDVRACRLVRVTDDYANAAWKFARRRRKNSRC